jgi:hypothetical protein
MMIKLKYKLMITRRMSLRALGAGLTVWQAAKEAIWAEEECSSQITKLIRTNQYLKEVV